MARVRSLREATGRVPSVHPTEVDCTWQATRTSDGSTLVTLSTHGSDNRVSQPKVSQTIQFDREMAAELVRVLTTVFKL